MNNPLPSNRSFALVFVVFFLVLAVVSWIKEGTLYPVFLTLSVLTGVTGIFQPAWLTPFNRVWMRFAELLHRVVNPVVLAILYFLVITPFGLILRIFRKDPLHRMFEPETNSYWIERDPPGPEGDSMKDQF